MVRVLDERAGERTARIGASLVFFLTSFISGIVTSAASEPLRVITSFSILGDLVQAVGGIHVTVTSLVGPEADAHAYNPSPADARRVADASLIVVNGLGYDDWIDRLVRASGSRAAVAVATRGVLTIAAPKSHYHGNYSHPTGIETGSADPHAWQNIANTKVYVANIRDALSTADPVHAADYESAARRYAAELDGLEAAVRSDLAKIPVAHRRIITTHDSFGYFAAAYGLQFIAPQGVSTNSEATPREVARIITQIRREKIPAVFIENIADPRLMEQVARESGARIGGRIYSDALSRTDGPAPTYVDLMRSNAKAFSAALEPR